MKIIIALLMSLMVAFPAFAQKKNAPETVYEFTVLRVLDGDTLEVNTGFALPPELGAGKFKIRVLNVDTPEKGHRAQCPQENELALKATAFTKNAIINAKSVQFKYLSWDKFGGRILAVVYIDGVELHRLLIMNGLAREYHGEKKQSWCN